MVRRGEYLERAVVIPCVDAGRETTIDGLYHRGGNAAGLVVAPPHPDRGSMEVPLVAEVAWAAARAGHPTLRFNYPGVGASPGDFSPQAALDSVASASQHLQMCGVDALYWVGVGWGGVLMSMRATIGQPEGLVLVQPPADVWPTLAALPSPLPVTAILAEHDPAEIRTAASEGAASCSQARVMVVAGADPAFRAGLVDLGRLVVETLSHGRRTNR